MRVAIAFFATQHATHHAARHDFAVGAQPGEALVALPRAETALAVRAATSFAREYRRVFTAGVLKAQITAQPVIAGFTDFVVALRALVVDGRAITA